MQITELQDHVLHRTCRRCADTLWARRPLLAAGGRSRWDSRSRRCWRSGSVPLLPRGAGSSSVVPPAEPSSHRKGLRSITKQQFFFLFFFLHTVMTRHKQQKPVSWKWKAKQLKTAESQILLASALVVSMCITEVLWTPLCGGVVFASPHNLFGFLVYSFNLLVLHLSNIQYN